MHLVFHLVLLWFSHLFFLYFFKHLHRNIIIIINKNVVKFEISMDNSQIVHVVYCFCNLLKEKPSTFFTYRSNALHYVNQWTSRNVFQYHINKICQLSSRLWQNDTIRAILDKLANIWLIESQLDLNFKFNLINRIFTFIIKKGLFNNLYSHLLIFIFFIPS